jgi:hypothetical protein
MEAGTGLRFAGGRLPVWPPRDPAADWGGCGNATVSHRWTVVMPVAARALFVLSDSAYWF